LNTRGELFAVVAPAAVRFKQELPARDLLRLPSFHEARAAGRCGANQSGEDARKEDRARSRNGAPTERAFRLSHCSQATQLTALSNFRASVANFSGAIRAARDLC
jgi:hypothetical protein